jgi:hypothetical protein
MICRMLPLALVLGLVMPALAADKEKDKKDDNKVDGVLTAVSGNKLTLAEKDSRKDQTYTVASDATITCDGKECKLDKLVKGSEVSVWFSKADKTMVTKIEAKTSPRAKDK